MSCTAPQDNKNLQRCKHGPHPQSPLFLSTSEFHLSGPSLLTTLFVFGLISVQCLNAVVTQLLENPEATVAEEKVLQFLGDGEKTRLLRQVQEVQSD